MSKEVSGLFSFILGVTAGVALGILFAPKSGEETREDIKETIDNLKYKEE
ncbi:YtxH domain-containing protein [Brachyspira aalborgi]|uniref:YtxH domain-containing protein n=1 Tax=Brachyspira aalborgi TaxID=29522 RepID=A0A5C8F0S7_9SPIR|nr:YtxH domain-containing protein [Brachyspira aalborgi]TXJ43845.1 YtxH domain-containing protein [Brachyspira aalborgi]